MNRRRSLLAVLLLVLSGCTTETVDRPPLAVAGDDVLAFRGDSITLDGSQSLDPEGQPLAYAWTVLSQPAGASTSAGTTAAYTFAPTVAGSYVFSLTVTDAAKQTATDVVSVEVRPDLSVTRVVPADGDLHVSGLAPVVAFFDAPIRSWTAGAAIAVDDVTDPANPVEVLGNVTVGAGQTAVVFTPVQTWVGTHDYQVTVSTAPMGLDGAPLRAPVVQTFTADGTDVTSPTVLSVTPVAASPSEPLSTTIEWIFSEPVDAATLAGAVSVADSASVPVDGTVTLTAGGILATFIPADTSVVPAVPKALAPAMGYTATISGALQDLSGNALAGDGQTANTPFSSAFTTTATADTTPPSILSVSPIRGAHGVSVKLPTVITFSEPVLPSTVWLSVGTNGGGVAGALSFSLGNRVAIFTPSANLATGTRYDVLVDVGVTDLSGNALPNAFASFFQTGSAPPPSVVNVSPAGAPKGSTVAVDVFGEDFVDGATAFLTGSNGGVFVPSVTYLSPTQLQASFTLAPSAATGPRTLTVRNLDGQSGVGLNVFSVLDLPPSIDAVNPGAADQGDAGVLVDVTGANFQSGATISISGTGITVGPTTFVSAGELTATISVDAAAALGARSVTVTNPDTQSATAANGFTVRLAAPIVTGISPGSGGQGSSLFSVLITGSNFQPSPSLPTVAMGNGVLASTVAATATSVTVNVTISGTATLGLHDVTVTNADGQSATKAGIFQVNAAPPSILSVSPAISRQQAGAMLTVSGNFFNCSGGGPQLAITPSTGITVGALQPGCTATSFTRAVTVGATAAIGLHDARVTNPDTQFTDAPNAVTIRAEAPTLASLSVTTGRQKQTIGVTLSGNFFQPGATVSFGSGIAVSVDSVTTTAIGTTISITTSAPVGLHGVVVTNPDGQSVTLANSFDVKLPLPVPSTVSPNVVSRGGAAIAVTVTGSDFDCSGAGPALAILFGGSAATGVTVNNASGSCTATSFTRNVTFAGTAAAPQADDVQVTNPDGGIGTLPASLTVRKEPPQVTSLGTTSGRRKANVTVNVNGSFFQSTPQVPTVSFGAGIGISGVTFVSASQLQVTISIDPLAAQGLRSVTVTNADGQSATLANAFTVLRAVPTVGTPNPSSGSRQQPPTTVTINGDQFDCSGAPGAVPTVAFNDGGISVANVTCPGTTEFETTLTATVTLGATSTVGLKNITVTNPGDPTGAGTGTLVFNELAEKPTLTSAAPNPKQGDTTDVTLLGSFFQASPVVATSVPGATVGSVTFVASTTLVATISVPFSAAIGTYSVSVTNPDGQTTGPANVLTVDTAPAPTVANTSPSTGAQGDNGDVVTVNGTGFQSGATVSWSNPGITDVGAATFISPTQLQQTINIGAAATLGAGDVTVTNPVGTVKTGTGTNVFTVTGPAPTVTSITPNSGAQNTAVPVTIGGTNFRAGAAVDVGAGITVSGVTVVNATTITATLTIAANAPAGFHTVKVTNSDASNGSLVNGFTVNAAGGGPTVSAIIKDPSRNGTTANRADDPDSIRNGQSALFHVLGTNFQSGASVAISGAAVVTSSVTFVSATRLDVMLQANVGCAATLTTGRRDVTVTNPPPGSGGNGLAGTLSNGLLVRDGLVINEIVVVARKDHNAGNGGADEMLELHNGSGCTKNLTDDRMEFFFSNNSSVSYILGVGGGGGQERYSTATCGGNNNSRTNFCPGAWGQVAWSNNTFIDPRGDHIVFVVLTDASGNLVDKLEIGNDPELDGTGDGAPCSGCTASNFSNADEAVARTPNGRDTDNDINDWFQSTSKEPIVGNPTVRMASTDLADNCSVTANCPPCSDGIDNDGDGWIDLLDPGCAGNPLGVENPGGNAFSGSACNDNLDNDMDGKKDSQDTNCFDGSGTGE